MSAGIMVEVPPLALFELYNAVGSWKEAAREYNAGCEARDCDHPYEGAE